MIALFAAATVPVVRGTIRPDQLLNLGDGTLTVALKAAALAAIKPFGYLGFVLLIVGLMQSLNRQGDGARDQLQAVARAVVLAIFIALIRDHEEWRLFAPGLASALAAELGSPGQLANEAIGNFVELFYPAGDLKSTAGAGTYSTWFFNVPGRMAEVAANVVVGLMGAIALLICFVAMFIGWIVGLVVVWLSEIFYVFGLVLVPAALGALAVDSLRSIGNTYLLGLVSVCTGKLALALANIGTRALLQWLVSLIDSLTKVRKLSDVLTGVPTDQMRQDLLNGVATLSLGGMGVLVLAILILCLWTIVTPIFAWKVFMNTLRTGAQFGSRLGFAFAGATLRAAGNAAELGTTKLKSAAQGGGGNGRGATRSGGRQAAGGGAMAGESDGGESGGSVSEARPMQAGAPQERNQPNEGARLTGAKLAQARARVGEAAFRAHLSECAEPQTRAICEKVAQESGAPPSQARELAAEVCGATPAGRPAEPAAQGAPAETPRPELARLANHLGVAAAVLRRASAHASEGMPEPTDNGVLAAVQRTLPRPEKAEKPS